MVLTQTSVIASSDQGVPPASEDSREPVADTNDIAATVEALCSGEPERVSAVLARCSEPPLYVVAHVIPLLASTTLYPEALRVLRPVAANCTGQLIDALVSPETPEPIRRRLPRVLCHCGTQRGLDGLMLGLEDESVDVRYACGHAIAANRSAPELRIDKERVLAIVKREATLCRTVWEAFRGTRDDSMEHAEELVQALLEDSGSRGLKHIFKILTLIIPREPLQVAFYGLHTNDTHLRGTALEYLEGVLPADVREELWPCLEDDRVKERPRMSSEAALQELLRTRARMGNELEEATILLSGEETEGE